MTARTFLMVSPKLNMKSNMFSPLVEKVVAGVITGLLITICLGMFTTYNTISAIEAFAQEGERFTQEDYTKHLQDIKEYRAQQASEMKEIKKTITDTRISTTRIEAGMSKQLEMMEKLYIQQR